MSKNVHYNLVPTNLTSTGIQSFKSGNPVIRFEIPENNHFLIPSSVRLAGKFRVWYKDDTIANSASGLRINERLGVYGAIDQLNFSSQTSKTQIESIRHYNKFLSSYFGITTGLNNDVNSHMGLTSLACGNYETSVGSVVSLASMKTTGNSFCVPLISGLTSGNANLDLSVETGCGGLECSLHLTPDSNFFFSEGADSASITNAFYEFKDLHLIAEAVVPSPDDLASIRARGASTLEYNSISSYFQTINSTNSQINMTLGKSRVLGVFANFCPASYINNLSQDGLKNMPLINSDGSIAHINQLIFTRGGERFPLAYNLDTLQKDTPRIEEVDSQIVRNYISSVKDFVGLQRTTISPVNTKSVSGTNDKLGVETGQNFGIGVSYTNISQDGVSFQNSPFGVSIECGLTSNNPTGVFLFAHCRNTLVMAGGGRIQVIS
jgi:hypothetical protein